MAGEDGAGQRETDGAASEAPAERSGRTGGRSASRGIDRSELARMFDRNSALENWMLVGVGTYLLVGLGTAISLYLIVLFPGTGFAYSSGGYVPEPPGGMDLIGSISVAYVVLGIALELLLGATIATGIGLAIGRTVESERSAPIVAAVATGVGAFAATMSLAVILLLAVRVALSRSIDFFGTMTGIAIPLVPMSIAIGATAAVAALLGRYTTSSKSVPSEATRGEAGHGLE